MKIMHLKNIKKWWVYASLGLLIISVISLLWAFTIPLTVESKVTNLAYEHTGKFDYIAYLNPSYLLGPDMPAEEETQTIDLNKLSSVKYPVEDVDRFSFEYTYNLTADQPLSGVTSRLEIKASGKDSDGEITSMNLTANNDITTFPVTSRFALPVDEFDWGKSEITIDVTVFSTINTADGIIFETFDHQFKIENDGETFVIARNNSREAETNLGTINLVQSGSADFSVLMLKNSPYGAITISPPALPKVEQEEETEPVYLAVGQGGTIYTKLLDRIEGQFQYQFSSSRQVSNLKQEAELVMELQGVNAWTKTIPISQVESQENTITIPFTISWAETSQILEDIRTEIGVSAESYNLVVKASVHVTADTDYGKIDETFSPTLTTDLTKGVVTWKENLRQTREGDFTDTIVKANTARYLGMPISLLKFVNTMVSIILLAVFLFMVLSYLRFRPVHADDELSKELKRLNKKYGERIVEAPVLGADVTDRAVVLKSMDDLIKVADELGKPIIHHLPRTPEQPHVYEIDDEGLRYCFILSSDKPE